MKDALTILILICVTGMSIAIAHQRPVSNYQRIVSEMHRDGWKVQHFRTPR